MPFTISKTKQVALQDQLSKLREERTNVETAFEDARDALDDIRDNISEKIEAYNSILSTIAAFRDTIVSELEQDFDDKSEKWQEGDKGQVVQAFIDEWITLDLEPIDIPEIPDIATPDLSHADEVEKLPEEPA